LARLETNGLDAPEMVPLSVVFEQRLQKTVCRLVCDLDIDEVVPAHTFVELRYA
jgi:hypothetical protein